MSTEKRRSFSKEFKINTIRMIIQEGSRVSEVARELDISVNSPYGAIHQFGGTISPTIPITTKMSNFFWLNSMKQLLFHRGLWH